ncbi:MAG TPA: amidohydrolase [Rhodothermales bacterium]|nr:amidohydrolase [Rhodothermales bacterium]
MSCNDMGTMRRPTADLVVLNARVWTADPANPIAQALAVRGDTLAFVGSNEDAEAFAKSAALVIDAEGQFVVPGFIDSHVHFLDGGFRLSSVQLRDAETPAEFVARIGAYAQTVPIGSWITGGDWDHERWGGELPSRGWIDSVTTDHPVWVNRLDGHMALANTHALKLAEIDGDVQDVDGGTIVRREGSLTGVFKDNAMGLVQPHIPNPAEDQEDRALDAAMTYVAEQGVTSVHDAGYDGGSIRLNAALEAFRRAHLQDRLKTRIYASLPLSRHTELHDLVESEGRGDDWLRIGLLKGFVDGSLGSHTAAFLTPFTDAPDDTGLLVNTEADLYSWISAADKNDLHVMTHAIGDRAIRTLLDIYDRVARENGPRDRRFRMEHAQHIDPEDLERFAELGVIASMQPYHAIDDGRWAEKVIGPDRIKTTYAFRSLLDNGARLAFGSDWYVAPPTPLEGIYAATTRRTLDGANDDGWVPEQKISVEEALRAYTIDAAFASFEENIKGSLEIGKLADFAMIDADLTQIDPVDIRDARVVLTVVGGDIVFSAP